MFGRKNKQPPEQAGRRMPQAGQPVGPIFSYYNNRSADVPSRRPEQRPDADKGQGGARPHLGGRIPLLLAVLVVAVCAVKLLLLGTNPRIVIVGNTKTSAVYMQPAATYQAAAHRLLASSITNRLKLTANLDGTAAQLERQFPELQAVSITLPLIGNRPIVYVQAEQPSVVLQSSHGNFALNRSGLVLARLSSLPSGIPTVADQSRGTPHPGKQYLPGSTISFIQTIQFQLTAAQLPVTTYVLPTGSPYELDVRLDGKPYMLRFNLVADSLVQSGAAIAAIQHLGSTLPAHYIDVRVPNRVFYQ